MDKIEKLFRKIHKADRIRLMIVLQSTREGNFDGLHVARLTNSKFYRIRIGDFRIIFSVDQKNKSILIESVLWRNERTYR